MPDRIVVLNGPNLNLLGRRQPEIYGTETLEDVEARVAAVLPDGIALEFRQSNHEGQLVDWIHEVSDTASALILNPGAFSHTSIAILDALNTYPGMVYEVHISQIHKREEFRHRSFVSLRADAVIAGLGTEGYVAAARAAVASIKG